LGGGKEKGFLNFFWIFLCLAMLWESFLVRGLGQWICDFLLFRSAAWVPSSREWAYAFCCHVCVMIFFGEVFAWLDFCLGSLYKWTLNVFFFACDSFLRYLDFCGFFWSAVEFWKFGVPCFGVLGFRNLNFFFKFSISVLDLLV
jgi:hypothetical protein